jgi:tyrosyl-tRNA synthetase
MVGMWNIFKQGVESIIPEKDEDKLKCGGLTIKFGADPSAPDLHLGHMVVLNKLRLLQDLGHQVQFLIGDFTAMIGDPTGKSETRKSITKEQVKENAESYQLQVFKILDPEKTTVVFNSTWLDKLSASQLISLSGRYTVARMLERDDFNKRFKGNKSISIHEFLYPLLQGYDSVELKSDVEIGGTDQTFNLLMGRHLQREYGQKKQQTIITVPILEGLDGVQKMSKSLNNHIGIMDEPKEMFGKLMSLPDTLIFRYFQLLTSKTPEDINIMKQHIKDGKNPRDFKIELAHVIITQLHSAKDAVDAEEQFKKVFSKKLVPDEMPEIKVLKGESIHVLSFIAENKIIPSKKEITRLIKQGAVTIDGERIPDLKYEFTPVAEHVLKIGKRKFFRLTS